MPALPLPIRRLLPNPVRGFLCCTVITLSGCAAVFKAAHSPVAHEQVRYDNVAIETLVQGRGPAVVMLPSLGRDGLEDFDTVAESLAASGFKVLRPQPRGVGKSSGPMVGQDLNHFARDVAEVIDRLGDGKAVIVGHAFGHFIARMTAMKYPTKVRGVVLAAASAKDTAERNPKVWATPVIAGDLSLPDAQRLAALELGFFAPGNSPKSWLGGWHPAVSKMQREKRVPLSEWWSAGSAPLLELIPEDDPFKPRDRWDELKVEYGPRVTVVTIPKSSHALFIEQPVVVAKAIADWSKRLP
ncbi:MAG: alpha/beta fold hydrolase [Hydrogenophaga sp.]|uniref:alpha/beta fold hydrolase n=1 Tax=Hydrogenophaga sp. TaxID=1904254 RepID=UPI00271675C5|nr:alpha/beta fold hydrolase [Hydrogenophaga sp.]MDO9482301.1 alpha/beta fold hydrolase [Hydrogenophaga sp.]MDP3347631.1 alpha/beta fold hydrolase [Hydrogenophaga sp.]MDP3806175.1 alpha/beta fold hydrolase [Hydrogenophaga sp.]MDP3924045.1 alpha/beta fold hydrolase [Hydrogenophaga sp.]MDZ4124771.1 alpha/beta fold hydrolase [Hydrogenophaga sp.]